MSTNKAVNNEYQFLFNHFHRQTA